MLPRKNQKKQDEERFVRNKLNSLVLFFLFVFCPGLSIAGSYFKLDSTLYAIQDLNYNLEFQRASEALSRYQVAYPNNSASYYLLHFNAFLKAFITEEETDYTLYRKVKDASLRHFENLPDTAPYKRFLQSEVFIHSAAVKMKHKELYSAVIDVSRVIRLIDENHKLFPKFIPNNKSRGLLEVYLSTVPAKYAWAARLLGVNGDLKNGLRLLNELAKFSDQRGEYRGAAKEAAYLYSFSLYQVAKKPREAWVKVFRYTKDYETNSLSAFFRANLAMKLNKRYTAVNILQSLEAKDTEFNFLFLDYMHGILKLNENDAEAISYLWRYYNEFKGNSFKQSCLQKISWYYVMNGETAKAKKAQKEILELPESIMEVDKQARSYAQKSLPLKSLLEIRLLCDNSNYSDAKKKLSQIDYYTLPTKENKVEYSYRYGQVSERLGNMDAAIKYYEACTLLAQGSKEYFGAYASIYLGDYYLAQRHRANALKFYNRALSYEKNTEYVESIEHKASIGIKRAKLLQP